MADNTPIEWADATVNAVNGCSVLSPGCKHCYAMKQAHRVDFRRGLVSRTAGGQVWTGEVYLHEKSLLQPLRWRRPRRIFWNAHGDLFHENVPDAWIDRVFAVCALTPQHTHMILTKRPERMRAYMRHKWSTQEMLTPLEEWQDCTYYRVLIAAQKIDRYRYQDSDIGGCNWWPLPNVWLGTSAEDQTRADERIRPLAHWREGTPAAVRFLSCEPLLGPVVICEYCARGHHPMMDSRNDPRSKYHAGAGGFGEACGFNGIDWVIVGGESGPGARPMHPDWARSLRDQCAQANVPFFFKQWGEWAKHPTGQPVTIRQHHASIGYIDADTGERKRHPSRCTDETMRRIGKKAAGRLLDGIEHSEFPA